MRRYFDDRGQVGGMEAIPFGILVFVAGTLIAVNGWAWLSTQRAADSIAREYLRAYTEQPSAAEAQARGGAVAEIIIESRSLDSRRVELTPPSTHAPCELAEVTVSISVPSVRVPFIGEMGTRTVSVTHGERMDPYRARSDDPELRGPTPCG